MTFQPAMRQCFGCKQPVVEGRCKHSPGCKVAVEIREQQEATETLAQILGDKAKYRTFLTESIAKHLIRLHQLAMRGSYRSAQQFREGALDILELLNEEGAKRDDPKASVPRGEPVNKQGGARGGTAGAVREVDGAPVGVAAGPRRGGQPGDPDEGRAGHGEPDKAVSE